MRLEGIITAIVTPFDDAGEIDYGAFERLIEQQIESGVDGLVPCGSTGEYYALSGEERAGVLEFVMRQAGGRVLIVWMVTAQHWDWRQARYWFVPYANKVGGVVT